MRHALVLMVLQAVSQFGTGSSSVSGLAIRIGVNEPIPGFVVQLSAIQDPNRIYSVKTTPDGAFLFRNVVPGDYYLGGIGAGYLQAYYDGLSFSDMKTIVVKDGQEIKGLRLPVATPSVIAGRIVDSSGDPVGGVLVEALRFVYQQGQRVLLAAQKTVTNDLGEYTLGNLAAGQYYVGAAPRKGNRPPVSPSQAGLTGASELYYSDATPDGTRVYVPTYFPGTTDPANASVVTLQPGAKVFSTDFVMGDPIEARRIRGSLFGASGDLVKTAEVVVRRRDSTETVVARQSTEGHFEISLPPGSYTLHAGASRNQSQDYAVARVPVDVSDDDIDNLSLVTQVADISGSLLLEGGATVHERGMINLESGFSENRLALIAMDGSFAFEGVPVGDYRVTIPAGVLARAYIKSIRFGPVDASQGGRINVESDSNNSLTIVLSGNSGSLDVSVEDDRQKPASNVMVVAIPNAPRHDRQDLYKRAKTNDQGKIHIDGLAPGDYKILAWKGEASAWENPDFIASSEGYGEPVHIEEGARGNVVVRLGPSPH